MRKTRSSLEERSRRNSDSGVSSTSSVSTLASIGTQVSVASSATARPHKDTFNKTLQGLDCKSSKFQPFVKLDDVFKNKLVSHKYGLEIALKMPSKVRKSMRAMDMASAPQINRRERGKKKEKLITKEVAQPLKEFNPGNIIRLTISTSELGRRIVHSSISDESTCGSSDIEAVSSDLLNNNKVKWKRMSTNYHIPEISSKCFIFSKAAMGIASESFIPPYPTETESQVTPKSGCVSKRKSCTEFVEQEHGKVRVLHIPAGPDVPDEIDLKVPSPRNTQVKSPITFPDKDITTPTPPPIQPHTTPKQTPSPSFERNIMSCESSPKQIITKLPPKLQINETNNESPMDTWSSNNNSYNSFRKSNKNMSFTSPKRSDAIQSTRYQRSMSLNQTKNLSFLPPKTSDSQSTIVNSAVPKEYDGIQSKQYKGSCSKSMGLTLPNQNDTVQSQKTKFGSPKPTNEYFKDSRNLLPVETCVALPKFVVPTPPPKQTETYQFKQSSLEKADFNKMLPPKCNNFNKKHTQHTSNKSCYTLSKTPRTAPPHVVNDNSRIFFKDDDQLSIYVSDDLKVDLEQCVSECSTASKDGSSDDKFETDDIHLQQESKLKKIYASGAETARNGPRRRDRTINLGCTKLPEQNLFTGGSFRDCQVVGNGLVDKPGSQAPQVQRPAIVFPNLHVPPPPLLVAPVQPIPPRLPVHCSEVENNSEITKWISRSSQQIKLSPVNFLHQTCWYTTSCNRWNCKYLHAIPPCLDNAISSANEDEVLAVYNLIMRKSCSRFLEPVLPMIINYHSIKGNDQKLLGIADDILRCPDVEKARALNLVLQGLTSQSLGYDFSKAVSEMIMYIGIKNEILSDILMSIIVQKKNFIADCWHLILNVTRFRYRSIDYGVVGDIVKACIEIDPRTPDAGQCITKVCRDLLLKDFVEISMIDVHTMTAFLSKMKALKMGDIRKEIKNLYGKSVDFEYLSEESEEEFETTAPCGAQNATGAASLCQCTTNSQTEFCSHNIIELRRILAENDSAEFAKLIRNCGSISLVNSLIVHVILFLKKIDYKNFYSLFNDTIAKLELHKASEDLKKIVSEIAFNILPFYDQAKDYKLAANIIVIFFSDIDNFLMCKCFYDEEPYRSNLRNDPQKLVFFIKLLTRGGYLEQARTCIKMEGFEIENNENPGLYKYKTDIVKEFLSLSLKSNLPVCKDVLRYLLNMQNSILVDCDLKNMYNKFMGRFLEVSMKDKSPLLQEFREFTSAHCKYLDPYLLRAILTTLYNEVPILELKPMYDFCCRKDIYSVQKEECIIFKTNQCIEEIKIVFHMYLIMMLHKKCLPQDIDIKIKEVRDKDKVTFGGFRNPDAFDKTTMTYRIVAALISFRPPVNLTEVVGKRMHVPQEMVKICLEEVRRMLPPF